MKRSSSTAREINDLLSRICDDVYPATPVWRNELINRRSLSSAAAAARRNLIQAMIEQASQENLGIHGFPPERSMYETLLRRSRLHREKSGEWGFYAPDAKSDPAVVEIWRTIDRFLADTEPRRLSVEKLFAVLRQPPFGLKDGILPVLAAAMLLHFDTEVALYEDGSFVPRLTDSVFERMFKRPERFEVQRFRIAGPRYEVFRKYAALLKRATDSEAPDLLSLVKPLVRLVRELPEYVAKTREVSPIAQSVLKSIRNARQPDRLLFVDIPSACGFTPFEAEGKLADEEVNRFFDVFRAALAELQRTYPQLLETLKKLVVEASTKRLGIPDSLRAINHDARLVLNLSLDTKLKSFLLRAVDDECDGSAWLESIATLLTNRPPTAWDDRDLARFELELAAVSRSFQHFKVLAFEMERSGVSLLDGNTGYAASERNHAYHRRVRACCTGSGRVPPAGGPRREAFLRVLARERLLDRKDVSVALLGQLVRELLQEVNMADREELQSRGTTSMKKTVRHILSISGGKDSTALAIYMRDRVTEMEYVFCDTDKELKETYEYLDKLEHFLGKKISPAPGRPGVRSLAAGIRRLPSVLPHALVHPHAQDQAVREVSRRRSGHDVYRHPGG